MTHADVRIENYGTVAIIQPLNQAAWDWVNKQVCFESWQLIGGSIVAEPRSVQPIIDGIEQAGLRVQA